MTKPPTVAFLHVGPHIELPTIFVRSVRRQNPDAHIVQCSDTESPAIAGIDLVARKATRHLNMMLFRMECFALLPTDGPTWFLDTDMICNRPLAFEGGPAPSVAVCKREFNMRQKINTTFGGMDMSEYKGRTFGEIWPYVGCATYTDNSSFWTDCLAEYRSLDPKFFNWYGDQEAIRNLVESGRYDAGFLPESNYACLPEFETPGLDPMVSHYKGQRKAKMIERAQREGLA